MNKPVLVAAAAAVAVALATPTGARASSGSEVLRLGGSTHLDTVRTSHDTSASAWYTVTVSGAVSYNGRGSLADCGHRDESGEAGWHSIEYPLLDGVPSPCTTRMDARPSHTYCWRQRGTGAPLTFTWYPNGGTEDDLGGLVITVDTAPALLVVRGGDCALAG
jgi:hypothetical protein